MKRGELTKKILLTVAAATAAGGLTFALAAAPGLGASIKPFLDWYQRQDKFSRYRIRKTFARLRRERFIEMNETESGKTKILLTENGKKKILKYQFDDMAIEPMKKWDRKWRMVMFDIPEKYKQARNALRSKLEALGFYQLQKSVWIHPYECRNEIDFIIEFFGVSPYVRMAHVAHFDGDEIIKRRFDM